nr:10kDa protein [Agapanthus velarivirus]QVY19208.1 10kDa protein [Agapanthus velarivirus]QVY47404.1 10kDa protein [Agapanthus velarivirus]
MPRSRSWEELKSFITNSGNVLTSFELGDNEKEVLFVSHYVGQTEHIYYLANNPEFEGKLTALILFDDKRYVIELRDYFPYQRDTWT